MEMVLPASYAVIEQEEMLYLDGGFYMNKGTVRSIVHALGFSAALNVATITAAIKINSVWMGVKFGAIGGVVGSLAGAALGTWVNSQAFVIADNLVTAYVHGKGVKWGLGVSWAIIPGLTGTVK
ncbi:hypothetical protein [Amphibacillus indicireducens]|uniref:Uncharacterized protein n=1 Tax=Amphibacillus indicireducens TaxID=1076330 RepID=A0ABP7VRZ5_9BACI